MPPRTWYFSLQSDLADGVLILSLAGRLTRGSVPRLRDALAEGQGGMLVDLRHLDYVSGPGLAAIRDAAEQAAGAGRSFVLCGLEGSVRIAFELAGLLEVLTVESNRELGLARLLAAPGR